ncbi:sensor histidine kinase [Roseomonas marmotae]|uniref:ATP-binding protein n=1 Tax=Roseomonas marmotae TaxID=2768161 RepID=UPI001AD64C89|nr:ATP-binding protein [Roseomonas marmotae]QTI79027.1 sensor histidine kinase [Roseomonas marmotae]
MPAAGRGGITYRLGYKAVEMGERTVLLPRNMDATGMYALLRQMFTEAGQPLATAYRLDFSSLRFIEPVGVTSLSNALELALANGCQLALEGAHTESAPIRYLDDSGFFELYGGQPLSPFAQVRETTVPLQRVIHLESHGWLDCNFLPWLASRLNMPMPALASMKMCMQEIFNNIQDHSGRDIGCIYMQHYPNKNEIIISISDFGVGIPGSMKKVQAAGRDAEIIRRACEEGVTSRSTQGNRGIGLDLLIRRVVRTNQGRVYIRSGRGCVSCFPRGEEIGMADFEAIGHYPGTLIEVKLRTDTLVPDEMEREDLEW